MASLGAVTEAEVPRPTLVPPRPEGAGAKVVGAGAVVAAVEAGAQPRGEQLDVVRLTALREVTCSELIPCSHPKVKTAVQI